MNKNSEKLYEIECDSRGQYLWLTKEELSQLTYCPICESTDWYSTGKSETRENLEAKPQPENPQPENPQLGWKQDFDTDDPEAVEAMLTKYHATVKQETEEGIMKDVWYVNHGKGSMDCGEPSTPEPIARAAGALFIFLWYEKNIQCDLARDLARAYWDGRIGRTI